MSQIREEVARLIGGVGSRRLRHALSLLADGDRAWDADALVTATGAPHRAVGALLTALGDDLRDGRIATPRAAAYRALAVPPGPADPVAHLLPAYAEIVTEMEKLVASAPPVRSALDHVAATADTVMRRALLLGAGFWLGSARLLCVGDHDLTSLAVALVHPGVEITVVDVDERILEFIDAEADRRGLPIRCHFADLRYGLPPGARAWADLAFTDPPYTPDGVALFTRRGLEGLRDRVGGRVLVAYGASDDTPALAQKVQAALGRMHVAYEAIWPDFNRYHGAPAIGSAADLYVLRPTARTWKALGSEPAAARIYSQGPQAVEAPEAAPEAAETTAGIAADLLVGEWPKGVAPGTPRVHLATWLDRPYAGRARDVAVALPPGTDALLPRVLLAAARAERVRVVTPATLPRSLRGVLGAVYRIETAPAPDGGTSPQGGFPPPAPPSPPGDAPSPPGNGYSMPGGEEAVPGKTGSRRRRTRAPEAPWIVATRLPVPDGPAAVLRHILDRPHSRIAGSWREGLIRHSGATLTKNEARARIRDQAPWLGDATVLDLPAHRLRALPDAIRRTAT